MIHHLVQISIILMNRIIGSIKAFNLYDLTNYPNTNITLSINNDIKNLTMLLS